MTSALQLERPKRITIVESIINQIVAQIRGGTLRPGDKLPTERQLMGMLGVSRSSVREALKGLEAMDLIEGRVGEGTFVKDFRPQLEPFPDIESLSSALQKDLRLHLNQARLIVEEGIVALAAQNVTSEQAKAILQALEAYEEQWSQIRTSNSWTIHDTMHLRVAEATGNPVLVRLLQHLLAMVPKALLDKGFLDGTEEQNLHSVALEMEIHRRLCEAVIAGNAEAAKTWMRRHTEQENQFIQEFYHS